MEEVGGREVRGGRERKGEKEAGVNELALFLYISVKCTKGKSRNEMEKHTIGFLNTRVATFNFRES